MKCCWWYKQPILRWKTFQELKKQKQLKRSLILRFNINHHSLKETCQFYCGIHKMALIEHALNINAKYKKKMYWIDCLPSTHQCSFKPENRFSLYTLQYAFENARLQESSQLPNWQLNVFRSDGLTLFLTHGKEWQIYRWKKPPSLGHPFKSGVNNERCAVKHRSTGSMAL